MNWIKENLFLFIVIVALLVATVTIVVVFCISYSRSKISSQQEIRPKSYAYGCQINFDKNRVIYFERKKPGNKQYKTIDEFFKKIHNRDVTRVKDWFAKLKNGEAVSDYLEVEYSSENHCFFSLYKFQKYDEANHILYLEFFIFERMPSSQGRKKEQNKEYATIKRNQIESNFQLQKKKKGFIFAIDFFFKIQEVISSEEIEKSILVKFKNEAYAFVKDKRHYRLFLDEYGNQIYVFDFKIKSQVEAEKLATVMYSRIQEFIEIKGYAEICGITIGVVKVNSTDDFNSFITKSLEAAESARANSIPYLFEEDSNSESLMAFDKDLIEKVFKRGSLKYFFRPILNVANEQTIGYFGTVKCSETQFESYFDISRYVNKVDRNKELLSKVLEFFVSKFYEERPSKSSKLILQISLVDLDHICKVLNNIPHSEEINLVLMFEETEVNANAFSLDLLHSQFSELKSLGYDIALLLKDENTLLESDFYENFNFFIIGSSMVSRVKESSRYRLSNKYLIESLLPYKRPIIINDLDGWASIELFVRSGCSLLSADELSQASEMILPIEKSKIARIRKIK